MTTHLNQPYHLVSKSPWPIVVSILVFSMVVGLVKMFLTSGFMLFFISFFMVLSTSFVWWRDVSREASLQGCHTQLVFNGLRFGMLLFILSEIMFFFSFFWAFFHSSLSASADIGCTWPPVGIQVFSPAGVPLLNTVVLLSSGVSVTWAHHATLSGGHNTMVLALLLTISLGMYFTCLQGLEYLEAPFGIYDSSYGSAFFMATGFHGIHVILGSVFLLVMLVRAIWAMMSSSHHQGLECSIWYWHFVDVVWLFLYVSVYAWGGYMN